jgi:hypothetical protein
MNYITENLITCYHPTISDNIIFIQGEHTFIHIQVEDLKDKINLVIKKHSDHNGNEVIVYLIQWEVPIILGNAKSKFIIYPEGYYKCKSIS